MRSSTWGARSRIILYLANDPDMEKLIQGRIDASEAKLEAVQELYRMETGVEWVG